MKIKTALIGAILVLVSVVFAACGRADDGKVTENAGTSASVADRTNTTNNNGIADEISSAAGDVSEGLSEAASELRSDAGRMFD